MSNKIFKNQAYKDRKGMVYVDADDVVSGLYRFANFTRAAAKRACKAYIQEVVPYMKREAPWKDRTPEEHKKKAPNEPHAREGLTAEYFEETNGINAKYLDVGVKLKHGVSYGVFLEYNGLYHSSYLSRRRPILVPTLESKMTLELMAKLKEQFSKITKV